MISEYNKAQHQNIPNEERNPQKKNQVDTGSNNKVVLVAKASSEANQEAVLDT